MSRQKKPKKPKPCSPCKGTGSIIKYSLREPFNPHSSDQVMELMRQLKLKIPKKRGEDRETTEAKYLKRYAKKYPVFKTILDCREKQKATSTYVYPTNAEGRVVTTFGFHPSTWRKSSRNVNLQNIPIRNSSRCYHCEHATHKPNECKLCACELGESLAEAIRGTMVAPPGYVLVEADYEGIEALIVGVCADDPSYQRVVKAGLHGFTASHWMGQPIDPNLPFDELRKRCKAIKKSHFDEYDRSKRGNHGVNYLLSAFGLADEWPEVFPKQKDAQAYIDFYFNLFPSIRRWHNQQLEIANRQTYLNNHYGGRHYFYNVFSWNKATKERGLGDDAKRAVAYVPQSDGSCVQNIDLLELAADPVVEPLSRLVIHDSFVLEVPLELVDHACSSLHRVMSRPRPELGGISIGVDISIGKDLRKSSMDSWSPSCHGTNSQSASVSITGTAAGASVGSTERSTSPTS